MIKLHEATTIYPALVIPRVLRSGSLPRTVTTAVSHLLQDYGWFRSVREGKVIDAAGMPIPWFTYPAIDYVRQLDLSEKAIFEWGAGFSTLFWSSRAKTVTSIETDPLWYSLLKPQLGSNCELILSTRDVKQYSSLIYDKNEFDVIIIDGTGESRVSCSRAAIAQSAARGTHHSRQFGPLARTHRRS